MCDAIEHRGPDDGGEFIDESTGVTLGFRRLAILDLSPAGHQPMASENGRYVIVFNGEIYNYARLRASLTRPVAFRGHSDTEVMLAAITEWGVTEAVRRAQGMFAMAIWDRETRQLHLTRDRLGEKPLYWARMGNTLLFGSELKALRAHPAWHGEIDRAALGLYLRHNYVPAPHSIYTNTFKIVPGTIATFTAATAEPTVETYWSIREVAEHGIEAPLGLGDTAAVEELDTLLRRVVGDEMVADVPLGAFLSGGVDSSALVALMQAQSARPVKTFTIGFSERGFDEAPHAAAVARHLGTEHTELYVSPADTLGVIPRLPTIYDEPFADSSQIPTYLVAQLARQSVTVSLSGEGGDELFTGYNRYVWGDRMWRRMRRVPRPVRSAVGSAVTAVSPGAWDGVFAVANRTLPRHLRAVNAGNKVRAPVDHRCGRARDGAHPHERPSLVHQPRGPDALVRSGERAPGRHPRQGGPRSDGGEPRVACPLPPPRRGRVRVADPAAPAGARRRGEMAPATGPLQVRPAPAHRAPQDGLRRPDRRMAARRAPELGGRPAGAGPPAPRGLSGARADRGGLERPPARQRGQLTPPVGGPDVPVLARPAVATASHVA
jgi:asparagine synthase (glutamine-hydrolysing)